MKLHELSPAAGSKRKLSGSAEVQDPVKAKRLVRATRARRPVRAAACARVLKAARCRCKGVYPRGALSIFWQGVLYCKCFRA